MAAALAEVKMSRVGPGLYRSADQEYEIRKTGAHGRRPWEVFRAGTPIGEPCYTLRGAFALVVRARSGDRNL